MHVHQSLFDECGNAFADTNDPDGMGLSSVAKSYIAGLLKYAPEYMLITNQYVNSYKRLVPGFDAPVVVSWGSRNRSAMVRVPRYKPSKPLIDAYCGAQRRFGGESVFGVRCHA